MRSIYVPWLHMHQPLVWKGKKLVSNLEKMLTSSSTDERWQARLMARAYKNPAKYVYELKKNGYEAKIMLDFSGILLECLDKMKKKLMKTTVDGERVGDIIRLYKRVMKKYPYSIEFAGTAYSHCYFPSTPTDDWEYQIEEWRITFRKLFGKNLLERVKGFWLPEMGVPGEEDKLAKLITLLEDHGYEWVILPIESVEGERTMSPEERIRIVTRPHKIRACNKTIPVIFRVRYDLIDQQAGCDAECVYERCLNVSAVSDLHGKPALIVPASDGENGNVMLNEFFPKTFLPFFKEKINDKVGSMTVSEFLHTYYEVDGEIRPESTVKIKSVGASWMYGHEPWIGGEERRKMRESIEEISREFNSLNKPRKGVLRSMYDEAKRALLIAETSCYVYWGSEFWFTQGRKSIEFARMKIERVKNVEKENVNS